LPIERTPVKRDSKILYYGVALFSDKGCNLNVTLSQTPIEGSDLMNFHDFDYCHNLSSTAMSILLSFSTGTGTNIAEYYSGPKPSASLYVTKDCTGDSVGEEMLDNAYSRSTCQNVTNNGMGWGSFKARYH
jgi:hypothetical protein